MMVKEHYLVDPWKIIEKDFCAENGMASESLFSLGNGFMGQRNNFEENYSGEHFQGSYIGGVYYPDKTRVGWWKNGYPDFFAKVLNAPSWIDLHIEINGLQLDLNTGKKIHEFERELDMRKGIYKRTFVVTLLDDTKIRVIATRFLSLEIESLGVINYQIEAFDKPCTIKIASQLSGDIKNKDSNWDDPFWKHSDFVLDNAFLGLRSQTLKTNFDIFTFSHTQFVDEHKQIDSIATSATRSNATLSTHIKYNLSPNKLCSIIKYGGYVKVDGLTLSKAIVKARTVVEKATSLGVENLKKQQEDSWSEIWTKADISIKGDVKAQQAIRYNIFQLNQTYSGKDPNLNIGPKGFTGEKYGGSTYWDTEAYCLSFYLATKSEQVGLNLLEYRYKQLDKAISNATKLGFNKGAALFPMVTMNGEECHNEWEITFEEIHRNTAIAFAIFNYERYTGDNTYRYTKGVEVLIGIARFWQQRVSFSVPRQQFVILGVTGPNEYENNVNNNWYTNYGAKWCLEYAASTIEELQEKHLKQAEQISERTNLNVSEIETWKKTASTLYLPYEEEKNIFLQQDGFLEKELQKKDALKEDERPINQHWSWDRILRSPYIKQADVLQGLYFFESDFSKEAIKSNFEFYEPFTVHESSLSPCIHAILAAHLGKIEQAYLFYLQTSRLDLDDYNHEVHEGLHITSMAGTWLSVVEGFGGMRVKEGKLHFNPQLPSAWEGLRFNIYFRGSIIGVSIDKNGVSYSNPDQIPIVTETAKSK